MADHAEQLAIERYDRARAGWRLLTRLGYALILVAMRRDREDAASIAELIGCAVRSMA